MKRFLLFFCSLAVSVGLRAQTLAPWQAGNLDLHFINTGCGECCFCIFPDGTTMMIDAGENNYANERHVAPRPNASRSAGEWITQYIRHFAPQGNEGLDYVLLTHFHNDHMGGVFKTPAVSGEYFLTGAVTVMENIPVGTLVDRGYPDYDCQVDKGDKMLRNYFNFLKHTKRHIRMAHFDIGSRDLFRLLYDPDRYAGKFSVTNLCANGCLMQTDGSVKQLFPPLESLEKWDWPRENSLSCAVRISYGKFDFYTGGDISGYPRPGRSAFHDVESQLAPLVGEVEVCKVNHHGYNDGTNETFISTLRPDVYVIQASDALHPNHSTLYRMRAKYLNPGKRDVFATNLHPAARIVIGELCDEMKSSQGHIVIRVAPDTEHYTVYVLEDKNTSYKVKAEFNYNCK